MTQEAETSGGARPGVKNDSLEARLDAADDIQSEPNPVFLAPKGGDGELQKSSVRDLSPLNPGSFMETAEYSI